jgi:hypothetical protein
VVVAEAAVHVKVVIQRVGCDHRQAGLHYAHVGEMLGCVDQTAHVPSTANMDVSGLGHCRSTSLSACGPAPVLLPAFAIFAQPSQSQRL